jgi:hypothetical protein
MGTDNSARGNSRYARSDRFGGPVPALSERGLVSRSAARLVHKLSRKISVLEGIGLRLLL